MRTDAATVLWELTAAAHPYGLRSERTPDSMLPDLVLLRPDGTEIGRLRYFEPRGEPPLYRSMILREVSAAGQAQLEAHIKWRLAKRLPRIPLTGLWDLAARVRQPRSRGPSTVERRVLERT